MSRRGWVLFVALGAIWGIPYMLIRISVREVSPEFLVLVRTGGGALLLSPFAARRGMLRPVMQHWKPLVAYTIAEIGVPWLLLFNAERKLTSSLSGLLVAAVPIVGAVLAQLTGTDRLDARRVAGLVLGICGVASLVGLDVAGSDILSALSLGVVAIGYAIGPWILYKHLSRLPGISVVASSLAMCAVAYAPIAAFFLPTKPLSGSVVASLVTLTVICSAVAFVAFFALVAEVGAMRSNVVTYLNPAVAVLLGITVLGERFNVGIAAGFVLILSGSYLATRPLRSPPAAADKPEEPGDMARAPTIAEP